MGKLAKLVITHTLSEIAARWGVSLATVLRYHIQSGKLAAQKDGKKWLVEQKVLKKYEAAMLADKRKELKDLEKRLSKPLGEVVKEKPAKCDRTPEGKIGRRVDEEFVSCEDYE